MDGTVDRRAFLRASAATLAGGLAGAAGAGDLSASGGAGGSTGRTTAAGPPTRPQAARPTGYHYDPLYLEHDPGPTHPERPERLLAADRRLREAAVFDALLPLPGRRATEDEVARVHDPAYVALARTEIEGGAPRLSTGDTDVGPASYRVALHATGAVLAAVDAVMAGRVKNAFCAVRPPGHHATRDRGMGFCIFNHVAVAARYAQERHGVQRVLVADWDVHHGNGTQDLFWSDGSVFYMSTHQSPFYPRTGAREETGEGAGAGLTLNRPFPAGAGDAEIVGAFRDDLLPAARRFAPDLVLVSAGFDSRAGDLLGRFEVTDDGYREITRVVLEIAAVAASGRVVSVLEGGYHLEGLASGVLAHVEELARG